VPKPFSDLSLLSNQEISSSDVLQISRRRFGRCAAVAAALSLSPVPLLATSHGSHQEPHDGIDLTPEQTREVDAKLDNIIRKYRRRLSDEQCHHLRRILGYNEKMLASVRGFPLQNGDPPAGVLRISLLGEVLSSSKAEQWKT
jgi:hypothetical protein